MVIAVKWSPDWPKRGVINAQSVAAAHREACANKLQHKKNQLLSLKDTSGKLLLDVVVDIRVPFSIKSVIRRRTWI